MTDTAREEEVGPEWRETHEKSVSGCSIRIIWGLWSGESSANLPGGR